MNLSIFAPPNGAEMPMALTQPSDDYEYETEMQMLKNAVRGAFEGAVHNRDATHVTDRRRRYSGAAFPHDSRHMTVSYYGRPSDIPQHIFRVMERFDRTLMFRESRMGGTGLLKTVVELVDDERRETLRGYDDVVHVTDSDGLHKADEQLLSERYKV